MTAWVTPKTWTSGSALTAAELNEQLRDNTLHLKETSPGFYSVGDWEPTLVTNGTGTLGNDGSGRYQKVGRWVTAVCELTANRGTASAGSIFIAGLPFASAGLPFTPAWVGFTYGLASMTGYTLGGYVQYGNSTITLIAIKDGSNVALDYGNIPLTPNCQIMVGVTYEAAS